MHPRGRDTVGTLSGRSARSSATGSRSTSAGPPRKASAPTPGVEGGSVGLATGFGGRDGSVAGPDVAGPGGPACSVALARACSSAAGSTGAAGVAGKGMIGTRRVAVVSMLAWAMSRSRRASVRHSPSLGRGFSPPCAPTGTSSAASAAWVAARRAGQTGAVFNEINFRIQGTTETSTAFLRDLGIAPFYVGAICLAVGIDLDDVYDPAMVDRAVCDHATGSDPAPYYLKARWRGSSYVCKLALDSLMLGGGATVN